MAKTKRDYLRRDMASAQLQLINAGQILVELEETFHPVHPEQAEILAMSILALLAIIDTNSGFCDFVWGHHPDNWEDWRAQHKPRIYTKSGRNPDKSSSG